MKEKKRDTSRKREAILLAAIEVFSQEGYDKASMDRIAELAGASKRTVYNHFAAKEELFQAVVEHFVGQMHAMKQIIYNPKRSVEEQLEEFANAELATALRPEWLQFIKVLLVVLIRDPETARHTAARYEGVRDSLEEWLSEATKAGALDIEDPKMAARVFWAMLGGAFTWPAVYQGGIDPQAAQLMKKELIQVFLSRYQQPSQT